VYQGYPSGVIQVVQLRHHATGVGQVTGAMGRGMPWWLCPSSTLLHRGWLAKTNSWNGGVSVVLM